MGAAVVRDAIVAEFQKDMVEADIVVPYDRQHVVGEVHERANVVAETWDADGAHFRVKAGVGTIERLRGLVAGR